MKRAWSLGALTLLLTVRPPVASAQTPEAHVPPPDSTSARAPDRLMFFVSAAHNSPRGKWIGRTPGRDVLLTSLRGVWQQAGGQGTALSYFAELVPLAVVTGNPTDFLSRDQCLRIRPGVREKDIRVRTDYYERCAATVKNALGVGVTPLGLEARLFRLGSVQVLSDASVGGIIFNRRMPYPDAAHFNFNIAAGAGIELPVSRTVAMMIGYRLHHLSSGGRGQFNPGVGAHAITIGWRPRPAPGKDEGND